MAAAAVLRLRLRICFGLVLCRCGLCGGSCGRRRSGRCSGWGWPGGEPREANCQALALDLVSGEANEGAYTYLRLDRS